MRNYEQEFKKALDTEYPLSQSALDGLKRIQVQLGLKAEDVDRIEQPWLKASEISHQEKLRQEGEQQRQEKEKLKRQEELKKLKQVAECKTAEALKSKTSGIDYVELKNILRDKKWKEANEKTLELMLKIAKPDNKNWIDLQIIQNFPIEDLQIIDRLWIEFSNRNYGFSVQKEVWEECGSPKGDKDKKIGKNSARA